MLFFCEKGLWLYYHEPCFFGIGVHYLKVSRGDKRWKRCGGGLLKFEGDDIYMMIILRIYV